MVSRLIGLGLLLVGFLAAVVALVWGIFAVLVNPNSTRAYRVLIGFDQIANAATGGSEDETISSRANRARMNNQTWGCILCRMLGTIQKDHCKKSAGV